MSEFPPSAAYLAVGASHRTSTARLRGRLRLEETNLPRLLAALEDTGEALALSSAERIEVFAASDDPGRALNEIKAALAREAGATADEIEDQLFALRGEEAVRHVFAVAAGLDSVVAGDPETAAQLGAARELARKHGSMGPRLEALVEAALASAARIGAESLLCHCTSPLSASSAKTLAKPVVTNSRPSA